MDAEMPIYRGARASQRYRLSSVLVMDIPDDFMEAYVTGQRPGVASTAAMPHPGSPSPGVAAVDGAAGPGRLGEVASEADRTNDDGAGVQPDAVLTA